MTRVRLFVYGSLRRGEVHHALLRGAEPLGAIETAPHYRLVESAGYLALVPGGEPIPGELYAVAPQEMPGLDAFEGSGYRRAPVRLADGSAAEAYFLAEEGLS